MNFNTSIIHTGGYRGTYSYMMKEEKKPAHRKMCIRRLNKL